MSRAAKVRQWLDHHGYDESLSRRDNARRVCDALGLQADPKNIAKTIARWQTAQNASESASNRYAGSNTYELLEDPLRYSFSLSGYDLELRAHIVEQAVRWYVSAGEGHTQVKVCRLLWTHYRVKIRLRHFRKMLRALQITKDSMPRAPHSLEPGQDIEALVEKDREQLEADYEHVLRQRSEGEWRRRYRKLAKERIRVEDLVSEVLSEIPPGGISATIPERDTDDRQPACDLVIVLTDWHIGRKVDTTLDSYSTEIAEQRIRNLCAQISRWSATVKRPVDTVYIAILGDMLDGVAGDMHDQQWHGQDLHGSEQAIKTVELLVLAVGSIAASFGGSEVVVHSVPGNHDRARKSRDEDPERIVAQLVYELAARALGDLVQWERWDREVVATWQSKGGTTILASHGDRTTRRIDRLALAHARGAEHTLVLTGHRHSLKVDQDGPVIHVQAPSLIGSDDYARAGGWRSRPGQVLIEIDERGPCPARLLPL